MSQRSTSRLFRALPQVALATLLVAVLPILIAWGLHDAGALKSEPLSILFVVLLSLLLSYVGGAFWRSRSRSGDLLFSELMVWGWLRRWWKERRLANVIVLLKGIDVGEEQGGVTRERRTQLLTQLAASLESSDPYTHGHSRRVARHSEMIARRMGLPEQEVAKVRTAAALHDVGKVNTPIAVLHKPDRLTEAEFELIKRHSVDGAEMVATLGDAELTAMVRHHHERLDGTGYPDALAGEQIPLGARIIAVADTFDAITSTRAYRAAKAHKKALAILGAEAGTRLDGRAVSAFHSYYWGSRPLALWVTLTNLPGRLASSIGGGNVAAASSAARVMAASALTTATAAAVSVPVLTPLRPQSGSDETVAVTPQGSLGSAGSPLYALASAPVPGGLPAVGAPQPAIARGHPVASPAVIAMTAPAGASIFKIPAQVSPVSFGAVAAAPAALVPSAGAPIAAPAATPVTILTVASGSIGGGPGPGTGTTSGGGTGTTSGGGTGTTSGGGTGSTGGGGTGSPGDGGGSSGPGTGGGGSGPGGGGPQGGRNGGGQGQGNGNGGGSGGGGGGQGSGNGGGQGQGNGGGQGQGNGGGQGQGDGGGSGGGGQGNGNGGGQGNGGGTGGGGTGGGQGSGASQGGGGTGGGNPGGGNGGQGNGNGGGQGNGGGHGGHGH